MINLRVRWLFALFLVSVTIGVIWALVENLASWQVNVVYAGCGCLCGCISTILGMRASSVTPKKDKFGVIECTSLRDVEKRNGLIRAAIDID